MWNKLLSWFTLRPEERERFESRWDFVDRAFKLVQWWITVGIVGAFARKTPRGYDRWLLIVITLVLLALVFWSEIALFGALQPQFSEAQQHRSRGYRYVVRLFFLLIACVFIWAVNDATLAVLRASAH